MRPWCLTPSSRNQTRWHDDVTSGQRRRALDRLQHIICQRRDLVAWRTLMNRSQPVAFIAIMETSLCGSDG